MANNPKSNKREPIFTDLGQKQLPRAGATLFSPPVSLPLLDAKEIAQRITEATSKLGCSPNETEAHVKHGIYIFLELIPGKAHINQPRELIEWTQKGLPGIPGLQQSQASTKKQPK